jgi:3-oxoacyl-[acyl-carrier-protein] synthase III
MAIFSVSDVRIAGMAACVPKNIISNEDYKWVSKKERDQLIKTTGVITKRVAPKGVTTSDMSIPATEKLLADLGWNKQDVELLIFISQSRDYLIPGTSHILQDKMGFPTTMMAFDISLGCSAFVYGLSVIMGMMSSGQIRKGLLIMGDTSSFASYRDKTTYPLFGDAATVTALEFKPGSPKTFFNLQTDGSGYEAIIIRGGGSRKFPTKEVLTYKRYGKGIYRNDLQPSLDGIRVFNFSLREVPPNMKKTLEYSNNTIDDIDYFVLHQANHLINDTLRKLMKVDKSKWPYSIHKYGNTSSASVPLTIVSELAEKLRTNKLKLHLCGFGVGLSWGSVIVEIDTIVCPNIIEY